MTPGIDVKQLTGENVAHWYCWDYRNTCVTESLNVTSWTIFGRVQTPACREHTNQTVSKFFFWTVINLLMELALISGSGYDLPLETFVILAGKSDNQSWLKIKGCFLSVLYSVLRANEKEKGEITHLLLSKLIKFCQTRCKNRVFLVQSNNFLPSH